MLVIGLTGGIASGKSTVSGLLKSYKIPIIDLDELAREVVKPGTKGLRSIQQRFKDQPDLIIDGVLNRSKLAEIIFNEPDQRKWLDQVLHPIIRKLMILRLIKFWLSGWKLCVIDSPLLIETGMWKLCGKVVVVYCSEQLQINRLKSRNQLSTTEAKIRISSQLDLKSKLKYADYIIDNSGSLIDLELQIERLIFKFDHSINRLIWLLNWLIPPIGIINGVLTIFWRIYIVPFNKQLRKSSITDSRRKRSNSSFTSNF